jgi:hypothetical protein
MIMSLSFRQDRVSNGALGRPFQHAELKRRDASAFSIW